jgi:hypothetical protein
VPLSIGDELNVLLDRSLLTAILSRPPRSGGFICWGPMNPNSQNEGYCSVPIRQIAAASTKPGREQNRAPENCYRLGFEPLPSNPSPGPTEVCTVRYRPEEGG